MEGIKIMNTYIISKAGKYLDCQESSLTLTSFYGAKEYATHFNSFLNAAKYCKINNGDFIESLTSKEMPVA